MPERKIRLNRKQLSEFLPDTESIREFERLFGDTNDIYVLVETIIDGAGLNDDGSYKVPVDSNYLDSSFSLYNAILILDNTAGTELIINTSIDKALESESQTVIVDATAGEVDITLPNPVDSINDSRSYKISIVKKDGTVNNVNILPFGSEDVVFEASQQLQRQSEVLVFVTDGTDWYIGD